MVKDLENLLFLTLMSSIPGQSWYSLKDADGNATENGFIAGINLPVGTVPAFLPMECWEIAAKTGASELPFSFRFNDSCWEDKENLLIRFATR
jgi:hypothetical protein